MAELWRTIVGYEGLYEISSQGRVRSLPRKIDQGRCSYWIGGQIMAPNYNHEGYAMIGLRRAGKRRHFAIHKLVLGAFVGPCPEGMEARHLDGNSGHPALDNLDYGTKQQNMEDRNLHGTTARGSKHGSAKLKEHQVSEIKAVLENRSQREIAKMYGVSKTTVRDIANGRRWRHVQ